MYQRGRLCANLLWFDLDVLSESAASAKLLLLTNYRPEYRHE